jgi:hypothetical protein
VEDRAESLHPITVYAQYSSSGPSFDLTQDEPAALRRVERNGAVRPLGYDSNPGSTPLQRHHAHRRQQRPRRW